MSSNYNEVLVIDDDPISRQVLQAFFTKFGTQHVHGAGDGAQACEVLRAHGGIDLIVCDLHMPDVNGIEFMNSMAADGVRCALVIVSSADRTIRQSAELLARALGLNCKGVLAKPVDLDRLAGLLGLTLPSEIEATY